MKVKKQYTFERVILQCREECRNKERTLIWSIWLINDGAESGRQKEMLVEGAPRRLKTQYAKWYAKVNDERPKSVPASLPEEFYRDSASLFLREIDLSKHDVLQKLIDVDAQMFLLLELLRGRLLPTGNVSEAFLRDETASHEKLIELFEKVPLSESTPKNYKERLRKLSEHKRNSCVRMLSRFFDLLTSAGGKIDNPWEDCEFIDPPKKRSFVASVKRDIEQNVLTDGQIYRLLEKIPEKPTGSFQDGILLAALLIAIESISPDEICGLDVEDVEPLPDFCDRWIIALRRVFIMRKERCNLEEMWDAASIRTLPLPLMLNPLMKALLDTRKGKGHLFRQKAHSDRRMTPTELVEEITELLKPLEIKKETNVKGSNPPGEIQLLLNTAEAGLRRAGYEDEELRYQQGKRPLLISAKSYCDFKNQVQLNKMGALQDRWLNNVGPGENIPGPVKMKPKKMYMKGVSIAPFFYGDRFQAELEATIDLTELDDKSDEFEDLELGFLSNYEAEIQIWLEEVERD